MGVDCAVHHAVGAEAGEDAQKLAAALRGDGDGGFDLLHLRGVVRSGEVVAGAGAAAADAGVIGEPPDMIRFPPSRAELQEVAIAIGNRDLQLPQAKAAAHCELLFERRLPQSPGRGADLKSVF